MTQIQLLIDASEWILNIITWLSLSFPVVVFFFWNWIESWWGRNIVAFEVCLGFATLRATTKIDWNIPAATHGPLFYFLSWLQTAALAFVPVIIVWRIVLIWKRQRAGAIARIAEDIVNSDKEEKDTIL